MKPVPPTDFHQTMRNLVLHPTGRANDYRERKNPREKKKKKNPRNCETITYPDIQTRHNVLPCYFEIDRTRRILRRKIRSQSSTRKEGGGRRGYGDTVRGNVKESEGKGEKEAKKRCPRVDPIGAPNLGIRICPLICGFHRNCLSTRRLATGTSHIHLLYATRSTAGPREDTRVFTFSRVFPSRETLPASFGDVYRR